MDKKSKNIRSQKIFIEPLEQRIMLDGAGASTFLDLIDERNQQEIKKNSKNKDIYKEGTQNNKEIPFTTVARDKARNERKNIVFIDSQVKDYREITKSFRENTELYLINSNEDGFKRIDEILQDRENINALHLIGHGSAGQILFGNAFLNNETIDSYKSILSSIGKSLADTGDILFYGCNVASTDQGDLLIKKISEITKADIAASDDRTGKDGDWELEKKIGIIETKNVKVLDYNDFLGTADAYGIASYNSNVTEKHSATNFKASYSGNGSNDGGQSDHPNDRFMITQERQNKTSGTFGFTNTGGNVHRHQYEASSVTASSTNPINIYLVYLNDNINRLSSSGNWGEITFEHEIIGIYNRNLDTIEMSGVSIDGATYPTSSAQKFNRRGFEDTETNGGADDWVVSNGNKTLTLKSDNGEKGDFIRVFTYASKPVANSDTGYINEGSALSVSDSASAVSGTSSGSHSGDVEANDTDLIGGSGSNIHTLTATSYEHTSGTNTSGGSLSSNGNSGTAGSNSVAGLYGTLDLEANGSYTYTASDNISGLDSGETVTDVFTYTITDGLSTDTATITITIIGQSLCSS